MIHFYFCLTILLSSIQISSLPLLQNNAEKEIINKAVNFALDWMETDFFFPLQPQNPEQYNTHHPDSIYVFFDPETFESKSISGRVLDSLFFEELPALKQHYQKEQKLWKVKTALPKKVCLIQPFSPRRLEDYSKVIADQYPYFKKLHESNSLTPYQGNLTALNPHPEFLFKPYSPKNAKKYKYATTAHLTLSSVLLNKERTLGIIQIGAHYMLGGKQKGQGRSGFGVLLLLSKKNKTWEITHKYGLWQE
ncbi:MAG: hypothetical protein ACRBFS_16255 [Aureispira sp.]